MYCVEYYDSVAGNGTKCFETDEARDAWLMGCEIENFYLFMEGE